jgi:cytochrome c oxidase cbb3-type subunit III
VGILTINLNQSNGAVRSSGGVIDQPEDLSLRTSKIEQVLNVRRNLRLEFILQRVKILLFAFLGLGAAALVAEQASAPVPSQQPGAGQGSPQAPAAPPGATSVRPQPRPSAYPVRPPADPAIVARGRQIFSANCSFCHGSDARGGEGGPNLIRSEVVMDDSDGELITTVVQNGRPDKGMPKFDLSRPEIGTIATFLHSIPVGGRAATTGMVDPLVGNARAGEAFFNGSGKCTSCHSVTGDLAGIGAKFTDVRALQGAMLSGADVGRVGSSASSNNRKTVTVTLASGQTVEGKLDQIDDFIVSLTDADGNYHSYTRHGDSPKVAVKNPLQPHLDMLPTFKDDDVHNLTAYLVTLK